MTSIFKPCEIIERYDQLEIERLLKDGYNAILLDVDNTIAPYFEKVPNKQGKDYVNLLKEKGINVYVFSNNTDKRVKMIADALKCDYICWALKPLPIGFIRAKHKFKLDLSKTICMGDQLLTDVLGANFMNVHSIYSKPLSKEDSFLTSINRKIERFIFKNILHEEV